MCHGQKSLYWGWETSHLLIEILIMGIQTPTVLMSLSPIITGNNGRLDPGTCEFPPCLLEDYKKLPEKQKTSLNCTKSSGSQQQATVIHPYAYGWNLQRKGTSFRSSTRRCFFLHRHLTGCRMPVSWPMCFFSDCLHKVSSWWFQPIWKILVKLDDFPK